MFFLEKYKPSTQWLLSVFILIVMVLLPGSPFTLTVLLPVIASRILPKYKLEIVFLYAIVFGIAFTHNFFSAHLYSYSSSDPGFILNGISTEASLFGFKELFLYAAGFMFYVILFVLIFKLFKKIFKKINFASSVFLSITVLAVMWIGQELTAFKNDFIFIFSLSTLMLARHVFYLFNYVRFFDHLPRNKQEAIAMIQPFWFLTSAIPENPIYQVEKNEQMTLESSTSVFYIFSTCFLFKLLMILYMSAVNFLLTHKGALIINDSNFITTFCMSIFRNWRNENVYRLLLCLFSASVSYLGTTFFIYGRVGIGLARLCGINLPDYINEPWKSQSFADFFSRIMYYYNIVIVNHFFYPALEFLRRFNLSKRKRIFIGLNWALIFGGFISHFLKDSWKIYKFGFIKAFVLTSSLALPAVTVLSLAVSLSLYFQKKTSEKKTNIFKMIFYFFLYSLIMPLNFSVVFGDFNSVVKFYLKIFTLGFFNL